MIRSRDETRESLQREMLVGLACSRSLGGDLGRHPARSQEAMDALLRMEAGMYGICVDCEKKIPEARLRAKPEAVRCIACQEAFEKSGR